MVAVVRLRNRKAAEDVVWAKLAALAEGARLASEQLFQWPRSRAFRGPLISSPDEPGLFA